MTKKAEEAKLNDAQADEPTNDIADAAPAVEAGGSAEDKQAEKPQPEPERTDPTTLHERSIAALSYLGFLAIVPFYLNRESEFCRFHGRQGLLLAILFYFCKLFMVLDLLMDLVLVSQFFVFVLMGFAALSGKWRKFPFIYDSAVKLEKSLTLKPVPEEKSEQDEGMPA